MMLTLEEVKTCPLEITTYKGKMHAFLSLDLMNPEIEVLKRACLPDIET